MFAARVRAQAAVTISDEHDDHRWVTPAEAHELVIWPAYHRAIEQVEWLVANPGEGRGLPTPRPDLIRPASLLDSGPSNLSTEDRGLIEHETAPAPRTTPPGVRLEGRPHPPDVRLRGRLARARHRDDRAERRRARRRPSAASTSAIPILAAAMDAVVDPGVRRRACAARRAGGPQPRGRPGPLRRPDASPRPHRDGARTTRSRPSSSEAYAAPIREELIARRIEEIHAAGSKAAVAATPGAARQFGPVLRRARRGPVPRPVAGLVGPPPRRPATTRSSLADFTRFMPIPVAVGNTTNAEAAYLLMEQGAAAMFVGVGPGAACTTREVLGIGIPQVTAIADVAGSARRLPRARPAATCPWSPTAACAAAASWPRRSPRARTSLMLGSPLARAPRRPAAARTGAWRRRRRCCRAARGSRSGRSGRWRRSCSARRTSRDGSQNLVGALRQSMAALGARTLRDMQAGRDGVRPVGRDRRQVLAARGADARALARRPRTRIAARRAARRLGETSRLDLARPAQRRTRRSRRGAATWRSPTALLVAAGDPDADWARNLEAEPRGRATIGDRTFEVVGRAPRRAGARDAVVGLILKYGTSAERLGRGPVFRSATGLRARPPV